MNPHNICLLFATTTALVFEGGTMALAQKTSPIISKPFALKAGLFFPNGNAIQSVFGETWFSGGVSYDFASSCAANPILYQFYFDYTKRRTGGAGSGAFYSSGSDVTAHLFGIGPAVKFMLAPFSAKAQTYVGVGAGFYRATVPVQYVYAVGTGGVTAPLYGHGIGTRSDGRFGGKVFAGYQTQSGFLAEADFAYVNRIDYVQTGGFGLRLGYRFCVHPVKNQRK